SKYMSGVARSQAFCYYARMNVIGITGTFGAGKGTVVEYLTKTRGFAHFSARALLTKEVKQRGLPLNRDSMHTVATEFRKNISPGYLMEKLYAEAAESGKNAVIESVRALGEIETLRRLCPTFTLFAVDARAELRYERIRSRQSETDQVSYKKFLSDEERENVSTAPWRSNLRACIKAADHIFTNNESLEKLHQQIEQVLTSLEK
ncbi:MAG: AAA family ATPase, partial [bacterium]|nr:AAA family ATPase [bacterium]